MTNNDYDTMICTITNTKPTIDEVNTKLAELLLNQ